MVKEKVPGPVKDIIALYPYCKRQLSMGVPRRTLEKALKRRGWTEETASAVLDEIYKELKGDKVHRT